MPRYSKRSQDRLASAHPKLQAVFNEVIKHTDCTILAGHRTQEEQELCVENGTSKLTFPNSPHNKTPSLAVDAVPYPVDWQDRERMCVFAGFVLGTAKQLGIDLKWGGDWNGNWKTSDETFIDMPHFQLVGEDHG